MYNEELSPKESVPKILLRSMGEPAARKLGFLRYDCREKKGFNIR
jgi:hypothetical protein